MLGWSACSRSAIRSGLLALTVGKAMSRSGSGLAGSGTKPIVTCAVQNPYLARRSRESDVPWTRSPFPVSSSRPLQPPLHLQLLSLAQPSKGISACQGLRQIILNLKKGARTLFWTVGHCGGPKLPSSQMTADACFLPERALL